MAKKRPNLFRKCDCLGCDRCQSYAGRCERKTMSPETLCGLCRSRAEEIKAYSKAPQSN